MRNDPLLNLCSSVFTAKNIRHTAWYGCTNVNRSACRALRVAGWLYDVPTIGGLIEVAYRYLRQHRRCQYFFKNTLIDKTVFGRYSPRTTVWLPEFKVIDARADVVLVNGYATAFEIKTEFDDFSRLHSQVRSYSTCFPRVVLLIDAKHVGEAEKNAPPQVGISVLTSRPTVRVVREPIFDSSGLSSEAMFRLLRKNEYESLARSQGLEPRSIPIRQRYEVLKREFSRLPAMDMHDTLVECLRKRAPTLQLSELAEKIPLPLTAALYEYRMRKSDWSALISRLESRVYA